MKVAGDRITIDGNSCTLIRGATTFVIRCSEGAKLTLAAAESLRAPAYERQMLASRGRTNCRSNFPSAQ